MNPIEYNKSSNTRLKNDKKNDITWKKIGKGELETKFIAFEQQRQ